MTAKVRKQFLLDPTLLKKAREALGARTDTETVERALEEVVGDAEIHEALRELVESGTEIVDVYGRLEK